MPGDFRVSSPVRWYAVTIFFHTQIPAAKGLRLWVGSVSAGVEPDRDRVTHEGLPMGCDRAPAVTEGIPSYASAYFGTQFSLPCPYIPQLQAFQEPAAAVLGKDLELRTMSFRKVIGALWLIFSRQDKPGLQGFPLPAKEQRMPSEGSG